MSEININQTDLNITVTPNTTTLSVFTGGYACAQGNTTEVQFNNGGVIAGANGLTYDQGSQTTTAANLTVTNNTDLGDIGNITITGGNSGEVLTTDGSGGLSFTEIANANFASFAGNVLEAAQPNITSLGTLSNLDVSGNVTANFFIGNGSQLTGLAEGDEISNGTSNIRVLSANGNIAIGVNGNANILVATATGIEVPAANLGSVSNLVITGGNNGFVLQTDGTGNLTWTAMTGNAGNGVVGGSNTQIQYNDSGAFGGSAGFTFNKASNLLSAPGGITAVGNVQGNYIKGNGVFLTGITSTSTGLSNGTSNITIAENANIRMSVAGYANIIDISQDDANITDANIRVTNGNIIISNGIFSGNASGLTNIPAANLSGNVPSANTAITVTGNSQPNITSIGVLTSLGVFGATTLTGNLSVVGNANANNISISGNANAGLFNGNGSGLSSLVAANIVGTVANATHACTANTVTNSAQSNITSLGTLTGLTIASDGDINLSGSGSNVQGANIVSANFLSGTLTTAAQPNITSVGTLTGLTLSGNLVSTANIFANGQTGQFGVITASNGGFSDLTVTGNLFANVIGNTLSNGNSKVTVFDGNFRIYPTTFGYAYDFNNTSADFSKIIISSVSANANALQANGHIRSNSNVYCNVLVSNTITTSGNVIAGLVDADILRQNYQNTNATAGTTQVHANNVNYQRYNVAANGVATTFTVNYANLTLGSNTSGATYKTLIYNTTGNNLTIVPQTIDIGGANQTISNGTYALLQVDIFGNIDGNGVSSGAWLYANI